MTTKHKITSEQKQAVADLLGLPVDKIPEEVDWDENDIDEDDEEDADDDSVDDESDEVEEDDEDDEEDDEDVSDDDEDASSEDVVNTENAIADWLKTDKSLSLSDYLKTRGL